MAEGIQPPVEFGGCALDTFSGAAIVLQAEMITIIGAHAGEKPPLQKLREAAVEGIAKSPWMLAVGVGGVTLAAVRHLRNRNNS